MPFMKGIEPIRYTLKYLEAGKVLFKDSLQIFCINYNTKGDHHDGARKFVFWYLPQLQYKNQSVQILTLRNLTPSPFITCYFDNNESMLIDVDGKKKEDILAHVLKVLGKPEEVLKAEAQAREKKDNPANFGYMCEKACICEVPGQIPCPGAVPLPFHMRGKYIRKMREEGTL
ncbi:probable 28S ribosomal protein S25, mitochondrial [Macrosteles quadrilineatus]|uniref:probable 28S ribosomal protein S25, mitochondrial n=1 Tax=Macrosteles quadrilineatus TaxID=74068 RepID=UPI0023E1EF12|nr:probable 28S ribosomal protein S25, mitochondrial [Macrosteles quadrilineatus]